MVFSSFAFMFLFLPIVVVVYHLILRTAFRQYALLFLLLASLFFYGYWKISYLPLILFSMIANFYIGKKIGEKSSYQKGIFIFGVGFNVALLAYFKYLGLFAEVIKSVTQLQFNFPEVILPIGISFYTFQQIAYLSDIYTDKYEPKQDNFLHYALFVSFFPQLISGPIVHHAAMMPQFHEEKNKTLNWENIHIGLCFLSMGLAKKVLVADTLSPVVGHCFDKTESLSFLEAFFGSIAYTLQLYFDFSGYADMAVGCAYFFNIKLPYNFNSPNKALSIRDFWQRWHMTLSHWLRNYVYIPLGGNRNGTARAMVNVCLTFLIGGIWHGAGLTFIIWGALQGIGIVIHRIWSNVLGFSMPKICAWILTFLFVAFARIAFRSLDLERLGLFMEGFAFKNAFYMRDEFLYNISTIWKVLFGGQGGVLEFSFIMIILIGVTAIFKNSQELILNKLQSRLFNIQIALLLLFSLCMLILPGYSPEFIYFQF